MLVISSIGKAGDIVVVMLVSLLGTCSLSASKLVVRILSHCLEFVCLLCLSVNSKNRYLDTMGKAFEHCCVANIPSSYLQSKCVIAKFVSVILVPGML